MSLCDHQGPTFHVLWMYIIIRFCVTIRYQHFMFHDCTSSYDSVSPSDTNISCTSHTVWLSDTNTACSTAVHHHMIACDHETPTFYVPCLRINIRYYVTIQHQHFMFHACASTYDTVCLSHQHFVFQGCTTYDTVWLSDTTTFFFTVVPHHVILCDHSTVHQDSSLLCLHSSFVETEHPFFIRQITHVTVFNCPALGNCILSSTVDLVCARRQIPCSTKELNLHQTWPSSPWASSPPQQDSDQCTLSTVGATQMFTIKSSSWYQVSGHLHI